MGFQRERERHTEKGKWGCVNPNEVKNFGLNVIHVVSMSPKPWYLQSLPCTLVHLLDENYVYKILRQGNDLNLDPNDKVGARAVVSHYKPGGSFSPF